MPTYKNSFASPAFIEETIIDRNGNKLGTIRVKPSSVLWKPANQHSFYNVKLEDFTTWITAASTSARRAAS